MHMRPLANPLYTLLTFARISPYRCVEALALGMFTASAILSAVLNQLAQLVQPGHACRAGL